MDNLIKIVKQAAKEGALLLYTLADPSMAEATKKACDLWGVPSTDVLRPTIEAIASHIGVAPSGIPRSSASRKGQLSEDYFRRIEAIDFTIKQDDGAQPQNLARSHIVLVGVSRTGKTPLSIYLAQKGYKVANVPIVMGIDLPKALFEIDQDKIFGLTINPVVLQAIRKARANTLGFNGQKSNYAEMEHVRQELDHANQLFVQHPTWPVIRKISFYILFSKKKVSILYLRILHFVVCHVIALFFFACRGHWKSYRGNSCCHC
jgi:regulator of PEP synthase PpsR (kinase-PPPase family)